jgi:hypothetical protein
MGSHETLSSAHANPCACNRHELRSLQTLDECVSEVMRYLLAQNRKKPGVPVTYTDIAKRLQELQKNKKGIANAVIAHAQKQFLKLGWELVEVKSGAGSAVSFTPLLFLL